MFCHSVEFYCIKIDRKMKSLTKNKLMKSINFKNVIVDSTEVRNIRIIHLKMIVFTCYSFRTCTSLFTLFSLFLFTTFVLHHTIFSLEFERRRISPNLERIWTMIHYSLWSVYESSFIEKEHSSTFISSIERKKKLLSNSIPNTNAANAFWIVSAETYAMSGEWSFPKFLDNWQS